MQTGDVVLIIDELKPRGVWQTGIVTKTLPSFDDYVRNVEIRTSNGNTYQRNIAKLIPLLRPGDSLMSYEF